jgi:DNA-binding NarL/FixJ family response regulator
MQGISPFDPGTIRVAVLDNSRMATQLLCAALAGERSFEATALGGDSVAEIAATDPHIVLIGENVYGTSQSSSALIREVHGALRDTKAILLAEDRARELVVEAFRAGARGVFYRSESFDSLLKCVREVHEGHVWVSQTEIEFLVEAISEPIPMRFADAKGRVLLSDREQCVVRCVAEGLTNREIASQLELSEHTVKNYLFRIFEKLGVSSRVELILYTIAQLRPETQNTVPAADLARADPAWMETCPEQAALFLPLAMAESHRDGRGVPANKTTALMWFKVAEALVEEMRRGAKGAQKELKAAMSSEEVVEAQRRASEWLHKRKNGGPARTARPAKFPPQSEAHPEESLGQTRGGRQRPSDDPHALLKRIVIVVVLLLAPYQHVLDSYGLAAGWDSVELVEER